MLAFLDESGDPGRKIAEGSSRYFVVAVVTFADNAEAQACDDRIALLRHELKVSPGYEFHFAHNGHRMRERFLATVAPFDFQYHIFALNKDRRVLTGRGFDFKESLYKFTARKTFENASSYLSNATVVIDKSGERRFRDELASYLRRHLNEDGGVRRVKKIKIQRSDGNNLLQLADYVAGVSARAINQKANGVEWRRQYLMPHRVTERLWPPS